MMSKATHMGRLACTESRRGWTRGSRTLVHATRRSGPIALLLTILCATGICGPAHGDDFPLAAESARNAHPRAEGILIVHDQRPAGDYEGWNLWAWPSGGEGAAFPFSGSDAFGRYAVVTMGKRPGGAGFIVRLGD
ncbi:MAG: pullulanase-associated domain-containing protein [Phycisphaerales bacterium]|jgi:hypothetical protein